MKQTLLFIPLCSLLLMACSDDKPASSPEPPPEHWQLTSSDQYPFSFSSLIDGKLLPLPIPITLFYNEQGLLLNSSAEALKNVIPNAPEDTVRYAYQFDSAREFESSLQFLVKDEWVDRLLYQFTNWGDDTYIWNPLSPEWGETETPDATSPPVILPQNKTSRRYDNTGRLVEWTLFDASGLTVVRSINLDYSPGQRLTHITVRDGGDTLLVEAEFDYEENSAGLEVTAEVWSLINGETEFKAQYKAGNCHTTLMDVSKTTLPTPFPVCMTIKNP